MRLQLLGASLILDSIGEPRVQVTLVITLDWDLILRLCTLLPFAMFFLLVLRITAKCYGEAMQDLERE